MIALSEIEKIDCGRQIAEFLNVKAFEVVGKEKRYHTAWGNKTALGLYESIKRIIEEGRV